MRACGLVPCPAWNGQRLQIAAKSVKVGTVTSGPSAIPMQRGVARRATRRPSQPCTERKRPLLLSSFHGGGGRPYLRRSLSGSRWRSRGTDKAGPHGPVLPPCPRRPDRRPFTAGLSLQKLGADPAKFTRWLIPDDWTASAPVIAIVALFDGGTDPDGHGSAWPDRHGRRQPDRSPAG